MLPFLFQFLLRAHPLHSRVAAHGVDDGDVGAALVPGLLSAAQAVVAFGRGGAALHTALLVHPVPCNTSGL